MYDLLPEEKVVQLRARRRVLKRVINSYTVWEMWDPPLKSEEKIKKLKESWKVELETVIKILKENTRKKRESTRLKNQELARQKDEDLTKLKNQRAQMQGK